MSFHDSKEKAIGKRDGDSARPGGAAAVLISFEGHSSRDGYETRLEIELPVRLHDSPVDRRAFADRFLRFSAVGTPEQVADYLRPQLDASVATAVREHPVGELMDGEAIGELARTLKAAALKPLFAAGLEIDGEPVVRLGSAQWQRRRVEEAADAARLAAAQREGELLRRFEDIRRQDPEVPAGALLMGLPAGERVEALRSLLRAAASRAPGRIFAVSGDVLCEIDVAGGDVRPVELASSLGPLRSVRAVQRNGRPHLLVGARDGVYLLDPEAPESAEAFEVDVEGSPFGFSNLAYDEALNVVYATHADVGLVTWQIDLGTYAIRDKGEFDDQPPRQIDAFNGRTHVAAGAGLWRVGPDGRPERIAAGGSEPVVLVVGTERELILVRPMGKLSVVSRRDDKVTEVSGRGDVVAIGAALPWMGEARLVVSDSFSSTLTLLGPHDDVRTTMQDAQGPFKALAAGAGVVVAVSGDRSRLLCWRPWEERPFADMHVLSRTRSRLADVAVIQPS